MGAGWIFISALIARIGRYKWLFRETCLGAIFKDRLAVAFRTRWRFVSLDDVYIVSARTR